VMRQAQQGQAVATAPPMVQGQHIPPTGMATIVSPHPFQQASLVAHPPLQHTAVLSAHCSCLVALDAHSTHLPLPSTGCRMPPWCDAWPAAPDTA
jgi:hypothetical protein